MSAQLYINATLILSIAGLTFILRALLKHIDILQGEIIMMREMLLNHSALMETLTKGFDVLSNKGN
jgi:hypothetical protein